MESSTHNWIVAIIAVLAAFFAAFVYIDNRYIDTYELLNNPELVDRLSKNIKTDTTFRKSLKGDPGEKGESGEIPIGSILPFPGAIQDIPDNWYLCDGREIQVSLGEQLYQVIGNSWGGKKNVYYHLPDLRGVFLRGVDHGEKRDPEAEKRTAMFDGGNIGDLVGSIQVAATAMPNNIFYVPKSGGHRHRYTNPEGADKVGHFNEGGWEGKKHYPVEGKGEHEHKITGGDIETRPINAAVNWIIKYK